MAKDKITVGFIGAGSISEMHGRGVRACPQAEYVGVYDPDEARATAHAQRFGGRTYESLEQLLGDSCVDAVHVLSPHALHVPQAIASLEAGKHVLVEKPVAHEVGEIEKLRAAAERVGRLCVPAHNYIHAPSLRRAKRLIETGRLGKIYGFWMLYNIFHSEEVAQIHGGVTRAICVHHAYSLLFLLGRPQRVAAMTSSVHYENLDCEDVTSIMCAMPDGAIAHLWASFAGDDTTSDPWTVNYKVLGTGGGTSFSWGEARLDDQTAPCWDMAAYEESVACEIDYFINGCILRGQRPLSTLEDAIDALRIVETAERSAVKNGTALEVEYGTGFTG